MRVALVLALVLAFPGVAQAHQIVFDPIDPALADPGPITETTGADDVYADPDFIQEPVYRKSTAVGLWFRGSLRNGVQLPAEGFDYFTWDPILEEQPDRGWRRWGTDRMVRTLIDVFGDYRGAHPDAPRVGVMDIALQHGGPFSINYGGLGHGSHQNGLDADVLYPRKDGLERRAQSPSLVDQKASQDLVDRFVRAGAVKIFVGPHLSLKGPKNVVQKLIYHDDHMHVRLPLPGKRTSGGE